MARIVEGIAFVQSHTMHFPTSLFFAHVLSMTPPLPYDTTSIPALPLSTGQTPTQPSKPTSV